MAIDSLRSRVKQRSVPCEVLPVAERRVCRGDAVVFGAMLRVGDERANVLTVAVVAQRAADREQPVAAGRRRIRRGEHRERLASRRARQLEARARIDNLPRVHRSLHRRVVALAGEVEHAKAFHEKRPLLVVEDGEALVHFDLERVALHLAEVRVGRRLERHGGGHPVLDAGADGRLVRRGRPRCGGVPCLVARDRRARNHFEHARLMQLAEDELRVAFEHPLSGRNGRRRP